MTIQGTLTGQSPQVLKFESSLAVRLHDSYVKIYEMAIVEGITLQIAYPMRVVTGRAWRVFFNYVFAVLRKTLIVQDAGLAMTFIAERVV
jgi:hypothetical protein